MYRKYTSEKIFNGYDILPYDSVIITDQSGKILDIVSMNEAGEDVLQLKGMISPGFINCHCHLELSHMFGMIPKGTGLVDFVTRIIQNRETEEDLISSAIDSAEKQMIDNGVVAVGDICNTLYSIPQKSKNNLYYHNYIEVSGFAADNATKRFEQAERLYDEFTACSNKNSIVPHASYSVSKELFQLIAKFKGNKLLTIHNQETAAENEFIRFKSGDFLKLYEQLKINIDFFYPQEMSSLKYYLPFFNSFESFILVHNVDTTIEDVLFAKSLFMDNASNLFYCICPNANKYITNRLPDLQMLIHNECNIVLGTDSLASNDQLSILSEIHTLQKHFPEIQLEEMLKWATINGARALKVDNFLGSLEKGKKPGLLLITENKVQRLA